MSGTENAPRGEDLRLPAPAPLPAGNPGHMATDSQGVRKHDAEDIKTHGLDPNAAKKRSKTAPRSTSSNPVHQDTPVHNLRIIASNLPPRDVRHPRMNGFIPCFGMMFHLLATMNDKVCTCRPYAENGPVNDWIPQVSVIVFSILATIQCFRAMVLAGVADSEQFLLLNQFVTTFPLETITIPGPLVPFFRSLSISAPGFGHYQDVTPVLPPIQMTEERAFNLDMTIPGSENRFDGLTSMIPNVPLMLAEFYRLISWLLEAEQANPHNYSGFTQLETPFGYPEPTGNANTPAVLARLRKSVGFSHRPTASNGLMARFANYAVSALQDFPTVLTYDGTHAGAAADPTADPPTAAVAPTWTTMSSYTDFLGFRDSTSWFSIMLRGMHTFNRHWKGNCSMLSIHPTTSTAGMILFKQVSLAPTTNANRQVFNQTIKNKCTHYMQYNSDAATTCPYIVTEDLLDAQIAQVNVICTTNINSTYRIGDIGITRFGDFWNVSPDVMVTDRGNLTPELQSMVSSSAYFTE